jgi:hypothetical protein
MQYQNCEDEISAGKNMRKTSQINSCISILLKKERPTLSSLSAIYSQSSLVSE